MQYYSWCNVDSYLYLSLSFFFFYIFMYELNICKKKNAFITVCV